MLGAPRDPTLSLERASEILGIPRRITVRRIQCGDLKARMVGTRCLIEMSDLVAFREQETEREAAIAEFSELTDEMAAKYGF